MENKIEYLEIHYIVVRTLEDYLNERVAPGRTSAENTAKRVKREMYKGGRDALFRMVRQITDAIQNQRVRSNDTNEEWEDEVMLFTQDFVRTIN